VGILFCLRSYWDNRQKYNIISNTRRIAPAEVIPLPDKSVQLITICTAAHYMDLEKVYAEGRRVLADGGVMAILGNGGPKWNYSGDIQKDKIFQEIANEVSLNKNQITHQS